MEECKMRFFFIAALAVALVALASTDASARKFNDRGGAAGYCPAGTCAKGGGSMANNVKYCSAANCRKATTGGK